MTDTSKSFAALIASLIVVSSLGGVAIAPADAQTSGTEGMLALGDAQVSEDVPADANLPIRASDLEGAVYASDHADTLEVVLTTPERAEAYMGENASVLADDEIAIVLRDDEVSDGRDVAIDLDVLEEGVGFVPEVAYGTHEDGERWESAIEPDGTVGRFNVPHFSENAVTFTGGVSITADPATDGSQFSYELSDLDSASNATVNLTGTTTKQRSNESKSDVGTETVQLNVSGNAAPKGPSANNKPTVTFSATPSIHGFENGVSVNHPEWAGWSGDGIDGRTTNPALSGSYSGYIDGKSGQFRDAVITRSNTQKDFIAQFRTSTIPTGSGADFAGRYRFFDDSGTEIGRLVFDTDGSITWEDSDGVETIGSYQAGQTYNIRMSWDFASDQVTIYKDGSALSTQGYLNSVSGLGEFQFAVYGDTRTYIDGVSHTLADNPAIDVNGDGTDEASVSGSLYPGESATKEVGLSSDTSSVNVSTAAGVVDLQFDLRERTVTNNLTVELNSETVSHDGVLADGETTSLSIPASELQEGTNQVNVSVGDGSLSSDAPPAAVGLELSHEASDTQTVDYGAETWSERYNITRTYGDATEEPTLTIPFEGEVVDINSVEVRRNGSSWGPPKAWTLDNTTLTVEFDAIDSGETLEVRAIGRKVRTVNGDIQVLEPTVEGDSLNSKIEITDRSEDFAIDVSGSDRIHYTAEESWGASSHAVVEGGGGQELRLPEASVGSQTRVRTAPLNVVPESGASEVVIEDPDEPRFQLREGNTTGAATIDVTYYDTLSGERYVLWSESQEREIDADRAESPVSFTTDGQADTYTIRQQAAPGSTGGGAPVETRDVGAPLVLVVPAVGVSVAGLFWAGRRFGGARGIRGNALLLVGSTVVAIAAVELVAPGTISSIVSTFVFALSDTVAGGIGAALAAVAVFIGLWQLQQRTRADIPWWVIGPAMGIAAVAALEAIRPGSVLGALEVVLSEYGGLVVLGGLALLGYVIYQRRQTQQAEASTPDTSVTLDLGNSEE